MFQKFSSGRNLHCLSTNLSIFSLFGLMFSASAIVAYLAKGPYILFTISVPISIVVVIGIFLMLAPAGIQDHITRSKVNAIESRLPDFLRDERECGSEILVYLLSSLRRFEARKKRPDSNHDYNRNWD